MKKMKMDNDFQNYLVEGAVFEGEQDNPCMLKFKNIVVPKTLISYSTRIRNKNKEAFIHCFEHDFKFSSLITDTKNHIQDFYDFAGVICPDPTITIGGSKTINQAQVYFSRAVGFFLQKKGIFAVPCIRWGDESTYEYCFLGAPENYIVATSTHGCIMPCKDNNDELRNAFIKGLPIMLQKLKPIYVIVYGRMPKEIFEPYMNKTHFIHFDSDLQNYFNSRKKND